MRRAVRLALFLQGHRLSVTADAPPPEDNVVFVANHTSYLDSAALSAVLPGNLSFVAYYELRDKWFEGPSLRALGTLFVQRAETETALRHTELAIEAARTGRPLIFYPEARIMRTPGLLEFHMGAFVTAAKAGVPVVPVAIRGCRSAMRHDHRWFPRRSPLSVHIGRPIHPAGTDFAAALKLRDQVRAQILKHCSEPDLSLEKEQV